MRKAWLGCVLAVGLAAAAVGQEIGFVERFVLAEDREEALAELIPGTPDFYFWHALHYQMNGQQEAFEENLRSWVARHRESDTTRVMRLRQHLIHYAADPAAARQAIRTYLNLQFNHQRQVQRRPDLPTRLDPDLIAFERLLGLALSPVRDLSRVEDAGLLWLDPSRLNPDQRRHLLNRLDHPGFPGLVNLVVADLRHERSSGFGSLAVHRVMTLEQLHALAGEMPDLRQQPAWIHAVLQRMQPSQAVDLERDPDAREAWLAASWAFVSGLDPAHNSLKTHILYRLLDTQRQRGHYDRDLFRTYLQLPRQVGYLNPDWIGRREFQGLQANLGQDFGPVTRLPPVGQDEDLVRDFLLRLLAPAATDREYRTWINPDWLRRVFVEAKLLAGEGDPEELASLWAAEGPALDPEDPFGPNRPRARRLGSAAEFQALRDRVDILFPARRTRFFSAEEPVALEAQIKNVASLRINVFEINALAYFLDQNEDISTGIDLDGLVATWEQTHEFRESPFRRVARTFEFKELDRPGIYVIDFIGSGVQSRALVVKGALYPIVRSGPAGFEVRVFDEAHRPQPQAEVWLRGQRYAAGEDGAVVLPYSTEPGPRDVVLRSGDRVTRTRLEHPGESYELRVGFQIEPESLRRGEEATGLLRTALFLNGEPMPPALLKNVRLDLVATDAEGGTSTRTWTDLELRAGAETPFSFRVPERLVAVQAAVQAEIEPIIPGEPVRLSADTAVTVNGIAATAHVHDLFLRPTSDGYMVDLRGRNGEVWPERALQVTLKHRAFTQPINVSLQTDADGVVHLGPLPDIDWVQVRSPAGVSQRWTLPAVRNAVPAVLHGVVGEALRIPYARAWSDAPWRHVRLLEWRGGAVASDHSAQVRLDDGFLVIDDLQAGDYSLRLHETGQNLAVRIAPPPAGDAPLVSGARRLERDPAPALQIASVEAGAEHIRVRLRGATGMTRLHVLGTRWVPAADVFGRFDVVPRPGPGLIPVGTPDSVYVSGRRMGDELRYVLDRRGLPVFPGNMLMRPELLLNPWAVRDTVTGHDVAAAGEAMPAARPSVARPPPAPTPDAALQMRRGPRVPSPAFSSYDFLAEGTVVLANLRPDEDGLVSVPREQVAGMQQLHLVALDPVNLAYRPMALDAVLPAARELRQRDRLDPEQAWTEQRRIDVLRAGQGLEIADMTTGEVEVVDSLAQAFRLMEAVSEDATLAEFRFLTRWPDLPEAERLDLYTKYASHELHLFLHARDRAFFDRVVRPHLEAKKEPTVVDLYLLGRDLSAYAEPWRFARLNAAEKVLLARAGVVPAEAVARHLQDLVDLTPPDPDRFNFLFDRALGGRGLDTETALGFREAAKDMALADPFEAPRRLQGGLEDRMDARAFDGAVRREVARPAAAPAPSADAADGLAFGYADDVGMDRLQEIAERRRAVRVLYRQLDPTREWAESNYYRVTREAATAERIPPRAFWVDWARHGEGEFLSSHLLEASGNLSEALWALATLDLPFVAPEHRTESEQARFRLEAGGPLLAFHRQILPAAEPEAEIPDVLVSQNVFRLDDRYRHDGHQRYDKFVGDHVLPGVVYGVQVVVTNPTSMPRDLRALIQIPAGAMPVQGAFYTRNVPARLEPFTTRQLETHFYFPVLGEFRHLPLQVAEGEALAARAPARTFSVVAELDDDDPESWEVVSQDGTPEAVLAFLDRANLNRIDLEKIAWRMRDRDYAAKVLDLLAARGHYHHTLWSYSLVHGLDDRLAEYLGQSPLPERLGPVLESPVLRIDPIARGFYEQFEYRPLVNARAHPLGGRNVIVNDRFLAQYQSLLRTLAYRPQAEPRDRMALAGYLFLQDRVEEALKIYDTLDRGALGMNLQFAYLSTYAAFYRGDPAGARRTAQAYADYPVPHWRTRFRTALAQLDEIEGGAAAGADDPRERDQVQDALAATEPALELRIDGATLRIRYRNLESARLQFYPMDIEMLFSRQPFMKDQSGQFSWIRPGRVQEIALPADEEEIAVPLPEDLARRNVMVEVAAGPRRAMEPYYATTMSVQVIESYGQVLVRDAATRQALPRVYVKVYARHAGGAVRFYKDGYTDLRGRFDFASLSTPDLTTAERFAVLILSPEHGAVIREAGPPPR